MKTLLLGWDDKTNAKMKAKFPFVTGVSNIFKQPKNGSVLFESDLVILRLSIDAWEKAIKDRNLWKGIESPTSLRSVRSCTKLSFEFKPHKYSQWIENCSTGFRSIWSKVLAGVKNGNLLVVSTESTLFKTGGSPLPLLSDLAFPRLSIHKLKDTIRSPNIRVDYPKPKKKIENRLKPVVRALFAGIGHWDLEYGMDFSDVWDEETAWLGRGELNPGLWDFPDISDEFTVKYSPLLKDRAGHQLAMLVQFGQGLIIIGPAVESLENLFSCFQPKDQNASGSANISIVVKAPRKDGPSNQQYTVSAKHKTDTEYKDYPVRQELYYKVLTLALADQYNPDGAFMPGNVFIGGVSFKDQEKGYIVANNPNSCSGFLNKLKKSLQKIGVDSSFVEKFNLPGSTDYYVRALPGKISFDLSEVGENVLSPYKRLISKMPN